MTRLYNDAYFHQLAKIIALNDIIEPLQSRHLDQAIENGFASLLSAKLDCMNLDSVDNQRISKIRKSALIGEATVLVRLEALREVLELAHSQNISMLLLKGFAFAHQIYPSPGNRPSSDIDIFIDEGQVSQAIQVFRDLGYTVNAPVEKSMISFQFSALKESSTGHTIIFDIHYKINNQAEYESLFEFSNVYQNAVPVLAISEHAKALCFADAYTFACVHLHGHYLLGDPVKGIWLYDIHLLLGAMTEQDQAQVLEMINTGSIGGVCQYWTNIVADNFSTQVPPKLKRSLAELPKLVVMPSVKVNPVKLLWNQFVFLPDARARLTFLRQLFIPPKQRLREKYPNSRLWLPVLYLRRAIIGFWSRLLKIGK